MLGFTQNWFGPRANPIGVDFGSDSLKLAQVSLADGEPQLIAAATAEVPFPVRKDPAARMAFFTETLRELLSKGRFKGRRAVLALPAASMYLQHLRVPKMDEEDLKKALPWEARGKLPIDPAHALLRHHVAGEIYHDSETKNEIILMAARRDTINQLLAAAAKARLEVINVGVEPMSLVNCFGHIYRRKADETAVNLFVDIGWASSRAVVAQGAHMLFARTIAVGGEHLTRAVASALRLSVEEARRLRARLCHGKPAADARAGMTEITSAPDAPPAAYGPHAAAETTAETTAETIPESPDDDFALLRVGQKLSQRRQMQGGGAVATAAPPDPRPTVKSHGHPTAAGNGADPAQQARAVEQACRQPLGQLVEELGLCRRYYEATFPSKPVERIIFVGGEARQRGLCQQIARELALAAQVGDPLVRMGRTTAVGIESGLDRRQPQPGWAVAIGLSLGGCGENAD